MWEGQRWLGVACGFCIWSKAGAVPGVGDDGGVGGSEGIWCHRPRPPPVLGCRSNLMGTKFTVFDNGANPDRANANWSNVRQELSAVVYVSRNAGNPPPSPGTPGQAARGVPTPPPPRGVAEMWDGLEQS